MSLSTPPPGPCPTRSGLRPPTKTQVQADQKAEKAQKSEAKENEKLAAAARKIKLKEGKQDRLILIAEERAKKATARARSDTWFSFYLQLLPTISWGLVTVCMPLKSWTFNTSKYM